MSLDGNIRVMGIQDGADIHGGDEREGAFAMAGGWKFQPEKKDNHCVRWSVITAGLAPSRSEG